MTKYPFLKSSICLKVLSFCSGKVIILDCFHITIDWSSWNISCLMQGSVWDSLVSCPNSVNNIFFELPVVWFVFRIFLSCLVCCLTGRFWTIIVWARRQLYFAAPLFFDFKQATNGLSTHLWQLVLYQRHFPNLNTENQELPGYIE
jgi:hypothetical protein